MPGTSEFLQSMWGGHLALSSIVIDVKDVSGDHCLTSFVRSLVAMGYLLVVARRPEVALWKAPKLMLRPPWCGDHSPLGISLSTVKASSLVTKSSCCSLSSASTSASRRGRLAGISVPPCPPPLSLSLQSYQVGKTNLSHNVIKLGRSVSKTADALSVMYCAL